MKIKKTFVFLFVIISLGISSYFLVSLITGNSNYNIKTEDFEEKIFIGDIDESRKKGITKKINEKYKVIDNIAGFSHFDNEYSLIEAFNILIIANDTKNDEIKAKLKNKMIPFLTNIDFDKINILNLYYYLKLADEFEIKVDKTKLKNKLEKNYDDNLKLFYIRNKNDSIYNKIWISGKILSFLEEDLFNIETGLKNTYNDFNFELSNSNKSFYNSGAIIINALCENNYNEYIDFENKLKNWLLSWQQHYDNMRLNNFNDHLFFADYLYFLELTGKIEDKHIIKSNNFYNSLTLDYVKLFDLEISHNLFKQNNNPKTNEKVYNKIMLDISNKIDNLIVENVNIDILETTYGIMLADEINFIYDKEKTNNLLNLYYNQKIKNNENFYEQIYYLYYYVLSFQMLNLNSRETNGKLDFKIKESELQKIIDNTFDKIKINDESLIDDIIVIKQMVDIISNLKIFKNNLNIRKKHVDKIKQIFKYKSKFENNIIITNLYRINYILNLNEFESKDLANLITILKNEDGGIKQDTSNNLNSDLYSTFKILKLLDFYSISYNNFLINFENFINNLEIEDGIFKLSNDKNIVSLMTISLGNLIYFQNERMGKNDSVK